MAVSASAAEGDRQTGTVACYKPREGYGFIKRIGLADLCFRVADMPVVWDARHGDRVEFVEGADPNACRWFWREPSAFGQVA